MFKIPVSPDFLTYILAALIAILCDWFPGVNTWFNSLAPERKRAYMFAALAIISAGIYGGVCANIFSTTYACDADGLQGIVYVFFLSLGINQGMHALSKPTKGGRFDG